jgi:Flp pilus assembly protein protease CpaA
VLEANAKLTIKKGEKMQIANINAFALGCAVVGGVFTIAGFLQNRNILLIAIWTIIWTIVFVLTLPH